ncbi:MAG: DUF58 domain-containing protein [bacterium]
MKDYRRFLNPEVVSRLSNIDLKARLVVEGFITGLHKSPYHGFSVEFAEHRQYMPGDSIRHIDWKVYAKSDRFYVKEYEEETNLKAYLLLDASGSMGYRSDAIPKLEYGSYLSAALSYLMLIQRDAVGLAIFDSRIRRYIAPRSVKSQLSVVLKELNVVEAGETTDVSSTFHQLAERIKRRGLIVIISDLFDDPQRILLGLKHFRHRKHEVIVFHILDPYERTFSYRDEARFKDMETGEELPTQPWHIWSEYRQLMSERIETFKRECRADLIDYVLMDTSVDFDYALFSYLNKRKRLG